MEYHIDSEELNAEGFALVTYLHQRYEKRCLLVHGGRNRNVFDLGKYVVKIPKNLAGFGDNDWEGSVSNSPESLGHDDYVQYPRTRLAYYKEVPIVFMEKVEPVTAKEIVRRLGYEPDWVNSVDCGQVGFNRKGRLLAYDYGLS